MKYNDYPENLPEVLVEKLNAEYNAKHANTLQEEYIAPIDQPATPPVSPPATPPVSPPITEPISNNVAESLQALTESEVNALVTNIVNGLWQLEYYLKEYARKSNNAAFRQNLNQIACSVEQTRNSYVASFNLAGFQCPPPPCFSQNTTRKWLREKIIELFYYVLKNMILLFTQYPANFGLENTLSTTLDDFYNFLTLPQIN